MTNAQNTRREEQIMLMEGSKSRMVERTNVWTANKDVRASLMRCDHIPNGKILPLSKFLHVGTKRLIDKFRNWFRV